MLSATMPLTVVVVQLLATPTVVICAPRAHGVKARGVCGACAQWWRGGWGQQQREQQSAGLVAPPAPPLSCTPPPLGTRHAPHTCVDHVPVHGAVQVAPPACTPWGRSSAGLKLQGAPLRTAAAPPAAAHDLRKGACTRTAVSPPPYPPPTCCQSACSWRCRPTRSCPARRTAPGPACAAHWDCKNSFMIANQCTCLHNCQSMHARTCADARTLILRLNCEPAWRDQNPSMESCLRCVQQRTGGGVRRR